MLKSRRISAVNIALAGLLAALVLGLTILSAVPPVSRDALAHHLAVPKLWLRHGGIHEIPHVPFSYYPMNANLLYMIPLRFGNDIIPKFIHFLFAVLTAALIFRYLKKRLNTSYALFGSLMFLSVPIIAYLSIQVYVDLALVFFTFASLCFILKWIETRFRFRFLAISAVFCGLALGTKYNGLLFLFLSTIIVFFAYSRNGKNPDGKNAKKALASAAIFAALALVVFSPWMMKNHVWTRNPVYPMYDGFFKSIASRNADGSETKPSKAMRPLDHLLKRHVLLDESLPEILLLPVRIFFQGKDDDWRYFDGKLNPFLFILPFFAFAKMRENDLIVRTEKRIFLGFSILFIILAFLSAVIRIRYIAPVIPPLVILSVFGAHTIFTWTETRISGQAGRFWAGGVLAILFLPILMNSVYIYGLFRKVDPLPYILGQTDRDAYIEKHRPLYATFLYSNRNLPEDAKILGIFLSHRGYHSDRDIIFDEDAFKSDIKSASTPEMILNGLRERGITHLIIRYDQFENWVKKGNTFSEKEIGILSRFLKEHSYPLFAKGGYGLYGLK